MARLQECFVEQFETPRSKEFRKKMRLQDTYNSPQILRDPNFS